MKPPRVAILGTGSAGMRHFQALRAAGARPVAVSIRENRRRELQKRGLPVAASLAQAQRLGARACVVATDTGRHARDVQKALALGLDVLVEKPAAADAASAQKLLAAAARRRRKLKVGCVLRFSQSLNRFRALLPKIGPVHAVSIECRAYLPDWRAARGYKNSYSARASEGGVLRDLIHEIDYAGWLFGWPARVSGRLENLGRLKIASEELAWLSWKAPGGASVTVGLDYLTRPSRRKMAACGARGTLEWDGIADTVTLSLAGRRPAIFRHRQSVDQMFAAQAKAFWKGGKGLAAGQDGARALAVCDAARRSSKSGRAERAR